MRLKFLLVSSCILLLNACTQQPAKVASQVESAVSFDIPYEKMVLDNGLTVILHEDHSDPIVAIATIVHVGSNREKPGRTGFAHFFEHMAFNNSENVPMGANRKMIPELGGTRNGGTWSDGTQYYEVVPKDAFEKLMWIDSDRFGYMINTVTEGTLEREKQVVKNEKRQRVDNRAYGHSGHVIRKNLYPADHPYNWTVIGDLEDLQNATLADVREFYDKYYIPANATLVIAGDIDVAATKASVNRWFGEIKKSPAIADLPPQPVSLNETKKRYHLDNFAKLPEIIITYPTIQQFHKDAYALQALASILSDGKKSPLYTTIVEQQKLSSSVSAYQSSSELAGTFTIRIRANAGVDLDDVKTAIDEALVTFEKQGIRKNDLIKIKAKQESEFYDGISSVLNKAFQLGIYNEYAGDPAFIKQDIANILAVTEDDILRVYNNYIKGKHAVITSFVPKDQAELTVAGSSKANIVEEEITLGKEKDFVEDLNPDFVKTPTKHDRSEPPLSELPPIQAPTIWHDKTSNGLSVMGIALNETPVINFKLSIDGGQLLDPQDKIGTAYLLALLMNEGTASKTPAELEDAMGLLGSSIQVSASKIAIEISGTTLKRNFEKTMQLVTDMLINPRFDQANFDRLKVKQLTAIKASLANPYAVAFQVMFKKLYGEEHIVGQTFGGTEQSVNAITFEDVIDYYRNNLSINNTTLQIVGDYDQQTVMNAMTDINDKWLSKRDVDMPRMPVTPDINEPQVYFIDFPAAKQSAIFVGKPTIDVHHPDFQRLTMVNNRMGEGSSARLTQILRIQKGYTYGAYSRVVPNHANGTFFAGSQVRSNVTLESMNIFKDQLSHYHETFSEQELAVTKNLLIKGNARNFETLPQLMRILDEINAYGYSDDYLEIKQQQLNDLSLDQARSLIKKHLNEQQMIYVIVGDAQTQLERVKLFNGKTPQLLDRLGNPL